MQNEFLPEQTPEYRPAAPVSAVTETAAETETTAENALTVAELPARFRALTRASWGRVTAFTVGMMLVAVVPVLLAAWYTAPTFAGAMSLVFRRCGRRVRGAGGADSVQQARKTAGGL